MTDLAPSAWRVVPYMHGHGPLMVIIDPPRIFLRADQVERLSGITSWGETLFDSGWQVIDDVEYYELETAVARCEAADTPQAAEFVVWLRGQIDLLLDDEAIDQAHQLPSFIGSYQVHSAARMLSEEPGIRMTRQTLFAHMHALGWLDRVDDVWTITSLARRNGWLTVREVSIPAPGKARARAYPQTYITPAGLAELRTTLQPAPAPPTTPGTTPALF